MVRVLIPILVVLSLHRDTNGVLTIFLIFFVLLNLKSIASAHLHLSVEESLSLRVYCADKHLGLAFKDDEKIFTVDERNLSRRWANQFKDLLAGNLIVDLQLASVEDCDSEVSWEGAEQDLLDFIVCPPKDNLVEDAEFLEGYDAYFLRIHVARHDIARKHLSLRGQHGVGKVVLLDGLKNFLKSLRQDLDVLPHHDTIVTNV